jgi:hypothetical protein
LEFVRDELASAMGKLGSSDGFSNGLDGEATLGELRLVMDLKTSAIRCMKPSWIVGRACPISEKNERASSNRLDVW